MNNDSHPQRLAGDSMAVPPGRWARLCFGRRMTRTAMVVVVLLPLVYLIEGLHGAWTWSRTKARLEARGERVAWADFVPGAAVPDEQNLFKHPYLQEYGIRHTWLELGKQVGWLQHGHIGDGLEAGPPVPLATLKKLPRQRVKPATLVSLEELLERLNAEPDQLQQFEEALARPHAQLRWTAETPLEELPKPNYVLLRVAAQGLGTRSSIHLLQAHPEAALRDLQFIKRLEKFAASDPDLTGVMINVAVDGLRAGLVEEALAAGLWPAHHLAAVQQEFAGIDRLTPWVAAIRHWRARDIEWLHRLSSGRRSAGSKHDYCFAVMMWQMTDLHNLAKLPRSWEDANLFQRAHVSAIRVTPRGWFYQNMAWVAEAPDLTQLVDAPRQRVHSEGMKDYEARQDAREATTFPYSFVAKMSLARFDASLITTARNQTRVNLAYVALALERHRAAKGAYPDTLAALVPEFAPALPHDLFDGQPLRYRRTPDGKYLLYSLGWNAKDDGGDSGVDKDGKPRPFGDGPDWVWQGVPTK